jgi:DNA-binding transcriptional MocR family regulator
LIEKIIGTKNINIILKTWIKFLKERQQDLVGSLKNIFPESEFNIPNGGYYIWVNIKNDLIANSAFRKYLKDKKGVVYVPGTKCAGNNNLYRTYTRLGFATYKDDRLIKGLKILKKGLDEFKNL